MTEKKINPDFIFWQKGEGMNRRHYNIEMIKQLIENGLTYQQIVQIAEDYFTRKKINEYYEIAMRKINNPIKESMQDKITKLRKEMAKNGN